MRCIGIRVVITEFVADDPQPGLVRFGFVDADGRPWSFVEKPPCVSAEHLDGRSGYPRPGALGCRVVGRRRDEAGRERIEVETGEWPEGSGPGEPRPRFEVPPDGLVEWNWGDARERPWDGRP